MRESRLVAAVFMVAVSTSPVLADDVAGSYEVKFEEMSTNCSPPPVTYTRGVVRIDANKSLRVNIETIPQMVGIPAKSGKINAKTTKKVATTVQGLDGKYGVSGRVDDNGVLQLVLVAEYTRQDNGKPHCTQSWNVSGVRGKAATPEQKPAKKSLFELPSLGD
jgi:hypothetical protein